MDRRRHKVSISTVSAATAGLTGVSMANWLRGVTTDPGQVMELSVIAPAAIGGANLARGEGTAFGAAVGARLIRVIRKILILLGISTLWQGTFIGFVIFAVALDRIRRLRSQDWR